VLSGGAPEEGRAEERRRQALAGRTRRSIHRLQLPGRIDAVAGADVVYGPSHSPAQINSEEDRYAPTVGHGIENLCDWPDGGRVGARHITGCPRAGAAGKLGDDADVLARPSHPPRL